MKGGKNSLYDDLKRQILTMELDPDQAPRALGGGLVGSGPGVKDVPQAQLQLRPGFIENSNVATTLEMTRLMQATRHFESMSKAIQSYDDLLGTAIRKLGETQ